MLIDTGYPGNGDRDVNRVLATIKQAGSDAARLPAGDPLSQRSRRQRRHDRGEDPGRHVHRPRSDGRDRRSAPRSTRPTSRHAQPARHLLVKPGDKVPIRDLDVTIVTANGERLTRPLGPAARRTRSARPHAEGPRPERERALGRHPDRLRTVPHAGPRRPDVEQGARAGLPEQPARHRRRVPDDAPRADAVGSGRSSCTR